MGFGGHVKRLLEADVEVAEICSMLKLVFHLQEGSRPSMASGTTILHYLEAAGVPAAGVSDIVFRSTSSATALVHEEYVDRALRQSGADGWFCKPHRAPKACNWSLFGSPQILTGNEHLTYKWRMQAPWCWLRQSSPIGHAMCCVGGSGQPEAHLKIEGTRARVGAAGLLIILE